MTDENRKKKKRGRTKFFRSCFRSVDDQRPDADTNRQSGKPVLIAVSAREDKDFIPDANLVNGDDKQQFSSSSRRRISRLVNAVLFNTKVKKIHRSCSKSSIASDTSLSSASCEKIGKSLNDVNAYGRECSDLDNDSGSRRSNLFSSSSRTTSSGYSTFSSSSINSSSRSSSEQKTSSRIENILDFRHPVSSNSITSKKLNPITSNSSSSRSDSLSSRSQSSSKPNPVNLIPQKLDSQDFRHSVSPNSIFVLSPNSDKNKFGGNTWSIRWCLFLLLSLVVLVVWGRIFSILCTCIWFYFVPCKRIKRVDSVSNVAESVDVDSKNYKKRVIMAGLLERSRR